MNAFDLECPAPEGLDCDALAGHYRPIGALWIRTDDTATRDVLTRWIAARFDLQIGDSAPSWGWYPAATTYRLSSWVRSPFGVTEWHTYRGRRQERPAAWGWVHWECPTSLWNTPEVQNWIGHEHAGWAALAGTVRSLVARDLPHGR